MENNTFIVESLPNYLGPNNLAKGRIRKCYITLAVRFKEIFLVYYVS